MKRNWIVGAAAGALTALLALGTQMSPFAVGRPAAPEDTAAKAEAILKEKCGGCHGDTNPPKGINVLKVQGLIDRKMILPKNADGSKLITVIESGYMPLSGEKLPEGEIRTLKEWINGMGAGSAAPKPVGRPQTDGRKAIPEAQLLHAIVRDLENADERVRPYLRYYSIANLANNPDVGAEDLDLYRTSLSKLVNSLSWNPDIVVPRVVEAPEVNKTLFRIDLRDYDWNDAIWSRIIAAYPYGVKLRDLSGPIRQIQSLSGAILPYIRVDWFVANAAVAPLYHDILQLPDNVLDLEKKLGVNAAQDLEQEKAVRAGVRNSGVSRNNRAIERHRSLYGAYWKSFDFAGNQGEQNIFKDPLNFQPNGGEFIFHLPNGLQGYLIANALGKRLDDAPITIVRDRTNPDDPTVHNGRSCIGCHFQGMNHMQDEIRPIVITQQKGNFDLEKAQALYVSQEALDKLFEQDQQKFVEAVRKTGSPLPTRGADEPVNKLALRYLADMSVEQAAADTGLSVEEFQKRIGKSSELEKLGFGQLQGRTGGIKRDSWEEYFGTLVEEIRLGDYLKPTRFHGAHEVADNSGGAPNRKDGRHSLAIGALTAVDPQQAQQARQAMLFWFNQSDDVRVVGNAAEYNLKGTLTVKSRDEVTVTVGDPGHNILEEATGSPEDLHFLTQQLANRVNFKIAGNWLPVSASTPTSQRATGAAGLPLDPVQKLQQAVGNQGGLSLTVDRGAGATYRFGEEVQIRFKVDKDCFLTVYDVDSQGNVSLLFPNQFSPDNRVQAGRFYAIPEPRDGWKIEVNGVPGMETVVAVATSGQTNLPGVAEFRQDVKGKSLGVVKREGTDRNLPAGDLALTVKQSVGAAGASTASVRFFTVK